MPYYPWNKELGCKYPESHIALNFQTLLCSSANYDRKQGIFWLSILGFALMFNIKHTTTLFRNGHILRWGKELERNEISILFFNLPLDSGVIPRKKSYQLLGCWLSIEFGNNTLL
jgi:hypothetical protein